MQKESSLASLPAPFMHNDCCRFMVMALVKVHGDRHQSYAYAVVLSYIMQSVAGQRWQLSYVTVSENDLNINTVKEPRNAKSSAYAHHV